VIRTLALICILCGTAISASAQNIAIGNDGSVKIAGADGRNVTVAANGNVAITGADAEELDGDDVEALDGDGESPASTAVTHAPDSNAQEAQRKAALAAKSGGAIIVRPDGSVHMHGADGSTVSVDTK